MNNVSDSGMPLHSKLPPFWPVVAIVLVILVTVIRLFLLASLRSHGIFLVFYPAVIFAALYGGLYGGLLATALSAFAIYFFLFEPRFQIAPLQPADALSLAIFVLSSVMISLVTEAMRRSREKLVTYQDHLEELVKMRTSELEKQLSERKQVEAALRDQAALLNLAHDAIIVHNAADEITFWSRGAEETYGWGQKEAIGRVTHDLFKTQFPRPMKEINEEAGQTGEWNGELIHTRKDGQVIVVASRWALQKDTWGSLIGTLEINRDITEFKKAEESCAQLAAIVDHSDDAIFSKTLDGVILNWNQGAQRMYGYSAEEVTGKSISILLPEGYKDEMPAILEKVRCGESVRDLDTVRMRKDGTIIPVLLTVSPIKNLNGMIIGASTIAHDITDRKQAEEALRESEDRFRTLAEAIPQLAYIAKADGSVYWCNRRLYEYTGKNLEQLENWGWQCIYDPKVLPRVLVRWKQSLAAGEPLDMEFPLLGADGASRQFLTRIMPLKDSSGRVVQWFGTSTDINELKQLEEQLVRRANDLAAVNSELESFSYSVAHDLRAPLAALTGLINILQEDYSVKLDDQGKEYLSIVAKSALKMNELISDILSLSKISRQEMQYSDVDMSAMAQGIIDDLKQLNPSRIIDITIQKNHHTFADESLLQLALQNLLSNAWKYTGKTPQPHIEFGAFDRDGKRIFYVKDNGTGFDMKDADKLFAPFKRLHNESDFSGVGVGLPIVDRVIKRHGGKIWAESKIGKGATFFFTLS